jgi:2-polyprenylphenol 6-hydroxylase
MTHYDVLIVGGGMVGAALACALGGSALQVAVIEEHEPPDTQPGEEADLRVSAITHASRNLFRALGTWQGLCARRVCPYREMHVWDHAGSGAIHFDCTDLGEEALGHIIENRVIQAALWERMRTHANVRRVTGASVAEVTLESPAAKVRLSDERVMSARLLVAADGADSRVRTEAGIEVSGWSYEQRAVVATVRTEAGHRDTAWQRFLSNGPLAFLPLWDGRCSIVWSTTPAHATELLALPPDVFLAELQYAFGDALGRMLQVGPRAAFPLRLQHARAYVRPRLALVGDAAHTIHPLAGQGVNLGFLDAAALAEVLLDAEHGARDIGAYPVLRRYERWRKGDNLAMMAAMDGFKRLFTSDFGPVKWARNLGLNLVNATGPAKRLFMRRAMGLEGDLPRLVR